MKEVKLLDDLKAGEFAYLIKKDGRTETVIKVESTHSELKGKFVISQYPVSGTMEYLSEKRWEEDYLHKYRVSGEGSWFKEYTEI